MEVILCQPSQRCTDIFERIMEKDHNPTFPEVAGSTVLLTLSSSVTGLLLNTAGYIIISLLFS